MKPVIRFHKRPRLGSGISRRGFLQSVPLLAGAACSVAQENAHGSKLPETPGSTPRKRPIVWVVDDSEWMIRLYQPLLASKQIPARMFDDRGKALDAFTETAQPPDLICTDLAGHTVDVFRFVRLCRALHPGVRIFIVSFSPLDRAKMGWGFPDMYLRKPCKYSVFEQVLAEEVRIAGGGEPNPDYCWIEERVGWDKVCEDS